MNIMHSVKSLCFADPSTCLILLIMKDHKRVIRILAAVFLKCHQKLFGHWKYCIFKLQLLLIRLLIVSNRQNVQCCKFFIQYSVYRSRARRMKSNSHIYKHFCKMNEAISNKLIIIAQRLPIRSSDTTIFHLQSRSYYSHRLVYIHPPSHLILQTVSALVRGKSRVHTSTAEHSCSSSKNLKALIFQHLSVHSNLRQNTSIFDMQLHRCYCVARRPLDEDEISGRYSPSHVDYFRCSGV